MRDTTDGAKHRYQGEDGVAGQTKTFTIYGASDDLIETAGVPGCDEFGAYASGDGPNASFVLSGPDGSMRIVAFYGIGREGLWYFAPCQVSEDVPLPDWPIRVHAGEPARGYSTVLEIEVPEGTTLVREEMGG